MVRLRHVLSKVVVSVSDETAALLGADWEPVDPPKRGPGRPKKTNDN